MTRPASKSLSLDEEGTSCWGLSGSSSALRFTGSLARGVDQKTVRYGLEEGTHMGGGEGEIDVEEGGVWLRKNRIRGTGGVEGRDGEYIL